MTTFLVLLAAYTLSQFYRSFLAIVAGELTRTLGLDAADLGSVSAIWFAAFALAQFPVGWSLDRLGPRRTLAGFMAMAVLGAAWFARAGSLADCLGVRALYDRARSGFRLVPRGPCASRPRGAALGLPHLPVGGLGAFAEDRAAVACCAA